MRDKRFQLISLNFNSVCNLNFFVRRWPSDLDQDFYHIIVQLIRFLSVLHCSIYFDQRNFWMRKPIYRPLSRFYELLENRIDINQNQLNFGGLVQVFMRFSKSWPVSFGVDFAYLLLSTLFLKTRYWYINVVV